MDGWRIDEGADVPVGGWVDVWGVGSSCQVDILLSPFWLTKEGPPRAPCHFTLSALMLWR